ncbi:putative Trichohyalin [Trypanosoma rangeli]|uniref:Putative Trichohyalin n=1 Tax=Trypanosoma rangeli TaxID=5698 RepID=A0A3R7REA5_TRYRA|nr:putative Trichohyalin [Trypanosoma rangeli]RNF00892.1 putative Trichohyalin [Trypanosoma rangeli]|eukprot:RNF00892.1 putative Trichohyalin [Trypanosoma rangeli]
MRGLLEDALDSGDVLELERAIISVQNPVFASPHRRRENNYLNDILLKCRKALVQHLEECGSLLKPLRRACRNLDEEALREALRKVHLAPSELRRYMHTDIQQAEALHSRMLHAADQAHMLLNCSDWREIEHFLDANTAILPDRTVVALMRRREALFAQRRMMPVDPIVHVPVLSSTPFFTGSWRKDESGEATATMTPGTLEQEEKDHRCVLVREEHAQRVLYLKLVMESQALLLSPTDGDGATSTQCRVAQAEKPITHQGTPGASPSNGLQKSNSRRFSTSTAASPNVSPIKLSSLMDSALRPEQRPPALNTSAAVEVPNDSLDFAVVCKSTSSMSREPQLVTLPRVWAQLRALMQEEDIHRRDLEGNESFERSVFLLPMAARSVLLTRVFPRRQL